MYKRQVYATLVGLLVYRCFDPKRLKPMLVDTACLSGSILLIIGTATAMAWALTQSGFSTQLAQAMSGLPGGAATFMGVSIAAFVILGSVLEGIPAIVLFGPLLFPIAHQMGIHEVHYAMVVILSMGLGLFAQGGLPGQRVRDFAERGLDGFFVLRHGNLPADPGAVQIGLIAARVKYGQQQGWSYGEAPGAVLEQAGQLAAGGACLRCQGDAREKSLSLIHI